MQKSKRKRAFILFLCKMRNGDTEMNLIYVYTQSICYSLYSMYNQCTVSAYQTVINYKTQENIYTAIDKLYISVYTVYITLYTVYTEGGD